jgi:hypothetical protein
VAHVVCDQVSPGLRDSEVIAAIKDLYGRRHFLRVERDFLAREKGRQYLPVGLVHVDRRSGAVLIELPQEAETGANRLWVRPEDLLDPIEAPA